MIVIERHNGRRPELTPDLPLGQVLDISEHDPIVCNIFGCSKHLTLDEQRCGGICFSCSQKEKFDINKIISK